MAVITPLLTTLSPTRTPKVGPERTMSSDEEKINTRLLDNFLESCRRITPTHPVIPAAANTTAPLNPFDASILNLPLTVIKQILRHLLTSPSPLILQPDSTTTASQGYRTLVEPSVLQTCKVFHNVGLLILYGENTLTTSSPATSYDFDAHLLSLRGRTRQMITSVRLEIDWADELWAKFPLTARALGELKGLRRLEIVIIVIEKEKKNRTALTMIEKDAKLNIALAYGQQYPPGQNITTTPLRTATTHGRARREGPVAAAMLKAEMQMLKDLVTNLKHLKYFRLIGFRNEGFARCLEERVRGSHHS